jgi:hypothetical protein
VSSSNSKSSGQIPVIHIGMPKAASTTLQHRLFAAHSEIYYLGRYDGAMYRELYRQYDACRNTTVQELMKQIAYENVYDPDFNRCKELLSQVLLPAKGKNLLPVWSWESYATDILAKRRVRARNLKKVFGKARIMIILRHPVALLESVYFQQLKRDNIGAYAKFGKLPYYRPIDAWLDENFSGEIISHLEYAETLRIYANLFGPTNVRVFLFEKLVENDSRFFSDLCRWMDIDGEEGLRLATDSVDNQRWTTVQLERLKEISSSKRKAMVFAFQDKKRRKKMLGLGKNGVPFLGGEKARAFISEAWQNKIYELTAEGNRWLQEVFNLPLAEYGYFG